MRATYNGDQRVVFSHYLDVTDPDHVTTLTAEPGQTYEIKQADAPRLVKPGGQFTDQELPLPPDGDWTEAKPAPAAKKKDGQADA